MRPNTIFHLLAHVSNSSSIFATGTYRCEKCGHTYTNLVAKDKAPLEEVEGYCRRCAIHQEIRRIS